MVVGGGVVGGPVVVGASVVVGGFVVARAVVWPGVDGAVEGVVCFAVVLEAVAVVGTALDGGSFVLTGVVSLTGAVVPSVGTFDVLFSPPDGVTRNDQLIQKLVI